jgi:hypothetical protein
MSTIYKLKLIKLSIIKYINIEIIILFLRFKNIYIINVTTLFSHESSRKTTTPHKLIWMDEIFM